MNNTDLNTIEIAKRSPILSSKPALIYIEMTQRCNCSCLMCYRSQSSFNLLKASDKDMDRSFFKKIASELFENAELIDLRGFGEPTIYHHMLDILSYIKLHFPQKRYKLITNGKEMNDQLCNAMADLKLDLYFSFDAADKKMFEYLRRGNVYELVVRNIKRWNQNYSPNNPARLMITIHNKNIQLLIDIAKFAVKNKCILLSISEIDPLTGDEWIAPEEQVLNNIRDCLAICSEEGIDIVLPNKYLKHLNINNNWEIVEVENCTAPYNSILIKCNGDVYTCSHRFGNMGNLIEQSFNQVWNNDGFQRLRSFSDTSNDLCNGCTRNNLAYIGTRGVIREKTWIFIEQQQSALKVINNG